MAGSGPEGEPFVSEEKEKKPEIKEIDGLQYEVVSTVQKPITPPLSVYSQEPESNLDDFHVRLTPHLSFIVNGKEREVLRSNSRHNKDDKNEILVVLH